jgi:hypothetical protein
VEQAARQLSLSMIARACTTSEALPGWAIAISLTAAAIEVNVTNGIYVFLELLRMT